MSQRKRLKTELHKLKNQQWETGLHKLWMEEDNVMLVGALCKYIYYVNDAVHQSRLNELKIKIPNKGQDFKWYNEKVDNLMHYQLNDDDQFAECVAKNFEESKHYLEPAKCVLCLTNVKWGYYGMIPQPCMACYSDTYMVPKYNESLYLKTAQMIEFVNLMKTNVPAAIQFTMDLYDKHHNYCNVSKREKSVSNFAQFYKKF